MDILHAIVFGIVQGLTEFFPVSSSAHLYLFQYFLGVSCKNHFLELSCHIGTLGCIFWYFRTDIKSIFCSIKKINTFFLAIIPLIPLYKLLKPFIYNFKSLSNLGFFFCVTAFLLFLSSYVKIKPKKEKFFDYLFIGSMQAMALFPGISRSGATISAARLSGWDLKKAASFSFLLSIPTVLGGFLLEIWKSNAEYVTFKGVYVIAGVCSFLTGLLTIRLFFTILKKERFTLFAWYCLILGIILIFTNG